MGPGYMDSSITELKELSTKKMRLKRRYQILYIGRYLRRVSFRIHITISILFNKMDKDQKAWYYTVRLMLPASAKDQLCFSVL